MWCVHWGLSMPWVSVLLFLGSFLVTLFLLKHYFTWLPLKDQNKCQDFAVSVHHSKHLAQSSQKLSSCSSFLSEREHLSRSKFNSSAITLTVNHVFGSAKSLTFSAFSWVPLHDRMTVRHLRHLLTCSTVSCGSQNSLLLLLLLIRLNFSLADWFHFLKTTFFSPNNTNEFM